MMLQQDGEAIDEESKLPLIDGGAIRRRHSDPSTRTRSIWSWWTVTLALALGASIVANVFLGRRAFDLQREIYSGRSKYTGIAFDKPVTFEYDNEWHGENETRSDELWEGVQTDRIAVALTDEWIDSKGLQRSAENVTSARFPWDRSYGIYNIKVFHQMHCLKLMRKAYLDAIRNNTPIVNSHHYLHCIDSLRQDLRCTADDSPMPILGTGNKLGDGQVRQCRDFDALVAWSAAPERNACYRTIDDYRLSAHEIERWQFCPDDSPFKAAKDRYFARYGHKSLFGEGEELV